MDSAVKLAVCLLAAAFLCQLATAQTCFDFCELDLCAEGSTCLNHDGGCFECLCPEGYTGQKCDSELPCIPQCLNGGECELGTCNCTVEYTGAACETPISCLPDCGPGTCVTGTFEDEPHTLADGCVCPPDYTGPQCQTPIGCFPECYEGVCYEDICYCRPEYTGRNCESLISPGEGYSCDENADNYACVPIRVQLGMFLYPYEGDCSKYVQCVEGPPIQCYVKSCPSPLIWDPYEYVCNNPTPEYNCTLNPPDVFGATKLQHQRRQQRIQP